MPAEKTVKFSESDIDQLPDPNTCSTEVFIYCPFATWHMMTSGELLTLQ